MEVFDKKPKTFNTYTVLISDKIWEALAPPPSLVKSSIGLFFSFWRRERKRSNKNPFLVFSSATLSHLFSQSGRGRETRGREGGAAGGGERGEGSKWTGSLLLHSLSPPSFETVFPPNPFYKISPPPLHSKSPCTLSSQRELHITIFPAEMLALNTSVDCTKLCCSFLCACLQTVWGEIADALCLVKHNEPDFRLAVVKLYFSCT